MEPERTDRIASRRRGVNPYPHRFRSRPWPILAVQFVFVQVVLPAGVGLLVRTQAVRLGPAGPRKPGLFGPATVVLTADGPPVPVWVLAAVADPPGFVEAVVGNAGGDHPLAVALRDRLGDGE